MIIEFIAIIFSTGFNPFALLWTKKSSSLSVLRKLISLQACQTAQLKTAKGTQPHRIRQFLEGLLARIPLKGYLEIFFSLPVCFLTEGCRSAPVTEERPGKCQLLVKSSDQESSGAPQFFSGRTELYSRASSRLGSYPGFSELTSFFLGKRSAGRVGSRRV